VRSYEERVADIFLSLDNLRPFVDVNKDLLKNSSPRCLENCHFRSALSSIEKRASLLEASLSPLLIARQRRNQVAGADDDRDAQNRNNNNNNNNNNSNNNNLLQSHNHLLGERRRNLRKGILGTASASSRLPGGVPQFDGASVSRLSQSDDATSQLAQGADDVNGAQKRWPRMKAADRRRSNHDSSASSSSSSSGKRKRDRWRLQLRKVELLLNADGDDGDDNDGGLLSAMMTEHGGNASEQGGLATTMRAHNFKRQMSTILMRAEQLRLEHKHSWAGFFSRKTIATHSVTSREQVMHYMLLMHEYCVLYRQHIDDAERRQRASQATSAAAASSSSNVGDGADACDIGDAVLHTDAERIARALIAYFESHERDPDNALVGLQPAEHLLERLEVARRRVLDDDDHADYVRGCLDVGDIVVCRVASSAHLPSKWQSTWKIGDKRGNRRAPRGKLMLLSARAGVNIEGGPRVRSLADVPMSKASAASAAAGSSPAAHFAANKEKEKKEAEQGDDGGDDDDGDNDDDDRIQGRPRSLSADSMDQSPRSVVLARRNSKSSGLPTGEYLFGRIASEPTGFQVAVYLDAEEAHATTLPLNAVAVLDVDTLTAMGSARLMERLVHDPTRVFYRTLQKHVYTSAKHFVFDLVASFRVVLSRDVSLRDAFAIEHCRAYCVLLEQIWLDVNPVTRDRAASDSGPRRASNSYGDGNGGGDDALRDAAAELDACDELVEAILRAMGQDRDAERARLRLESERFFGKLSKELDECLGVFLVALESHMFFLPTRQAMLDELYNVRSYMMSLANGVLVSYRAMCESKLVELHSMRAELLDGSRKRDLSSWWLDYINDGVADWLAEHGYNIDAVPYNYIDEAPVDLGLVHRNREFLHALLADLKRPDDRTLHAHKLIDSLAGVVLPHVERFLDDAKLALLYLLDPQPFRDAELALCGARSASRVTSSPSAVALAERAPHTGVGEFAELLADAVAAAGRTGNVQRFAIDQLIKDVEYVGEMLHLEHHQPDPSQGLQLGVVPITGIIVGRLYCYENEVLTVLDVWDSQWRQRLDANRAAAAAAATSAPVAAAAAVATTLPSVDARRANAPLASQGAGAAKSSKRRAAIWGPGGAEQAGIALARFAEMSDEQQANALRQSKRQSTVLLTASPLARSLSKRNLSFQEVRALQSDAAGSSGLLRTSSSSLSSRSSDDSLPSTPSAPTLGVNRARHAALAAASATSASTSTESLWLSTSPRSPLLDLPRELFRAMAAEPHIVRAPLGATPPSASANKRPPQIGRRMSIESKPTALSARPPSIPAPLPPLDRIAFEQSMRPPSVPAPLPPIQVASSPNSSN
jgi:hypothetical protein